MLGWWVRDILQHQYLLSEHPDSPTPTLPLGHNFYQRRLAVNNEVIMNTQCKLVIILRLHMIVPFPKKLSLENEILLWPLVKSSEYFQTGLHNLCDSQIWFRPGKTCHYRVRMALIYHTGISLLPTDARGFREQKPWLVPFRSVPEPEVCVVRLPLSGRSSPQRQTPPPSQEKLL